MTLADVFRVLLLQTRPQVEQRRLTQPASHGLCPEIETVVLGLPPGLTPAAAAAIWQDLKEKPCHLILDEREPHPDNPDFREIAGDCPIISSQAVPVVREILAQLDKSCFTGEIQANIIDSAADAIITINEDHLIVGYNQGAEKIFGFTKDEVMGQDLSIIIPPPHKERHREYVRRYIATRDAHVIGKHVQLSALRKNGEEFPMSISFSVAEIGGNLYFTGIIRDITEYVDLQEKLRQNERLAAVGNTVSQIVHEIKNPLMIIGGFAQQLLKAKTLDEKGLQKLSIIAEEVGRLETLMAEMRDYSRPPTLKREIGRIERLLQELMDLYCEFLQEKNIRLVLTPMAPQPTYLLDYQQLRQVLVNLIKNAAEAMPQGGTITLSVERRPPHLEIKVADTGEGMTPDVVENIFTPYFTTKTKGSGLGLAISRNIINAHHGEMTVESQPGKGTVFTVLLPLAEIEAGVCPV
ncbi:MAG: two-component system sensor histidine kinase NtrB [Desulfobacca sp.]|uniref:two-component system sensor histidine kinase NtrB n=2 Tax=Desulfobacca sp. TaxID=2067990 RepID=UPI004049AFB8